MSGRRGPFPAAPSKKQAESSDDDEDTDSDAEFLDELENDNELMEKMRSARIRENECMRETTSSELATALARGPCSCMRLRRLRICSIWMVPWL